MSIKKLRPAVQERAIAMSTLMRQLIIFLVPTAVRVCVHTAMSDQCNVNEDPAVIPVIFNKQICVPESSLDYFFRVVVVGQFLT